MKDIKHTLEDRGKSHGEFIVNSRISQEIKSVMRSDPRYDSLAPMMREALEMIAHKIGRIIAGDSTFKDHWHDVIGYATLVEERL